MARCTLVALLFVWLIFIGDSLAGQADDDDPTDQGPDQPAALDQQAMFEKFQHTLSGVNLIGHFTVLAKPDGPLHKEQYTILSAKKLDQGDFWLLKARIHYGDKDVTLPIPLEVKWAGDTPVITLTDFTIPGLGTFSSRVVIYNQKYAGTWTHGNAGGHLFGTIEKIDADNP